MSVAERARLTEIKRTVAEGLGVLLGEDDISWLVAEVERLSAAREDAADRDARRARASVAVMRLARTPAFRAAFPQRNLTIIPVLREDSVRYLFERLTEAGGYAVAVQADGVMRLVELQIHEVSS